LELLGLLALFDCFPWQGLLSASSSRLGSGDYAGKATDLPLCYACYCGTSTWQSERWLEDLPQLESSAALAPSWHVVNNFFCWSGD